MSVLLTKVKEFKKKYKFTIAWRLKAHSKIIDRHLNPGEEVIYAFAAQKNSTSLHFFSTYVVALTNKRILLAQKRMIFGYFFTAITPDLFNDLKVMNNIIWGSIQIDTIKEVVTLSNIQKSALPEIETRITEYMMEEKKKYGMQLKKEGTL